VKYDLAHCDDLVEHQDRGADCVIVHPVTGAPMPDLVFTIAGPDSDTQRRAKLKLQDELLHYRGVVPAEDQLRMSIEQLARCVVGWKVTSDGKPLEFTHTNVVRILTKFAFIREQVEAFAQNRKPYFARTPFLEEALDGTD
jgi:hypothetical protein